MCGGELQGGRTKWLLAKKLLPRRKVDGVTGRGGALEQDHQLGMEGGAVAVGIRGLRVGPRRRHLGHLAGLARRREAGRPISGGRSALGGGASGGGASAVGSRKPTGRAGGAA
ncbi:hypothetical protein E2562_026145 [Oryza meyeriana var. granulata]|uniref:Uncharacterized protein n=1 Tax=Oryza meyeriana var. granulata TaxID=110450 RepID=A0A6G1FCJ0_9ORYZ|nr:hypothetical protein E2562_026145 [Oryza meyeriana var. granulata]